MGGAGFIIRGLGVCEDSAVWSESCEHCFFLVVESVFFSSAEQISLPLSLSNPPETIQKLIPQKLWVLGNYILNRLG